MSDCLSIMIKELGEEFNSCRMQRMLEESPKGGIETEARNFILVLIHTNQLLTNNLQKGSV